MALIIVAHPNLDKSFANKTIVERLRHSNLHPEIRDIQNLYPHFRIDVKAEQEALLRHKTVVFQYPFYWYNMPAILKHWFDVVFEYQFAFGSKGDKLKGKNFVPSFSVGGSANKYKTLGVHHFRIAEFCKNLEQTAYFARMNYIEPVYFHGTSLADGFTEDDIKHKSEKHAERLLNVLNELNY